MNTPVDVLWTVFPPEPAALICEHTHTALSSGRWAGRLAFSQLTEVSANGAKSSGALRHGGGGWDVYTVVPGTESERFDMEHGLHPT